MLSKIISETKAGMALNYSDYPKVLNSLCWFKFSSALRREPVKSATLRRVFFFVICAAAHCSDQKGAVK